MDRLRSFLNLEHGEEVPAFLLFLYLTLIMMAYIITKNVRDGLFLYKFSPYDLPKVYLAIAAIIWFLTSLNADAWKALLVVVGVAIVVYVTSLPYRRAARMET